MSYSCCFSQGKKSIFLSKKSLTLYHKIKFWQIAHYTKIIPINDFSSIYDNLSVNSSDGSSASNSNLSEEKTASSKEDLLFGGNKTKIKTHRRYGADEIWNILVSKLAKAIQPLGNLRSFYFFVYFVLFTWQI